MCDLARPWFSLWYQLLVCDLARPWFSLWYQLLVCDLARPWFSLWYQLLVCDLARPWFSLWYQLLVCDLARPWFSLWFSLCQLLVCDLQEWGRSEGKSTLFFFFFAPPIPQLPALDRLYVTKGGGVRQGQNVSIDYMRIINHLPCMVANVGTFPHLLAIDTNTTQHVQSD